MKLVEVTICGLRSIGAPTTVPLGRPTLLAGHNDAGKSAVIDSIAFLLESYKILDRDITFADPGEDEDRPRVGETWVEGRFTVSQEEQDNLQCAQELRLRRVSKGGLPATLEVLKDVPKDERFREIEAQTVPILRDRCTTLGLSTDGLKPDLVERLRAASVSAETEQAWVSASSDLKRALPRVQRFDATSSQNPEEAILASLKTAYIAHLENEEISGSVTTLTQILERKLVADAEALRQHIKEKVEGIGQVTIHPTVRLDGGLKSTEVSVRNDLGEEIHLGQSGAGRARRIALAVWEYNARQLGASGEDLVLLYDEPDTHLDYRNQRRFMGLLAEQVSLPNVTVVIATHSMNLIDGIDIANVLHVRHENSRTAIDTMTDDSEVGKHLGAIAASLGLRNTVILHERLFVGVEGESERLAIPVLFKLATGRQLESCGIALWPCGNNDGALRFAQYLANHDREVRLLIDADSRRQKLFSDASLERHGLDPAQHLVLLGNPNELEDEFTDEQWAVFANQSWPRGDERDWTADDFLSCRGEKKFSYQVAEMLRRAAHPEMDADERSGKPAILQMLALSLGSSDEVPESVRRAFVDLIQIAAS